MELPLGRHRYHGIRSCIWWVWYQLGHSIRSNGACIYLYIAIAVLILRLPSSLGFHNVRKRYHCWWRSAKLLHSNQIESSWWSCSWIKKLQEKLWYWNSRSKSCENSWWNNDAKESYSRNSMVPDLEQPYLLWWLLLHWCTCWRKRQADQRWWRRGRKWLWVIRYCYDSTKSVLHSRRNCLEIWF